MARSRPRSTRHRRQALVALVLALVAGPTLVACSSRSSGADEPSRDSDPVDPTAVLSDSASPPVAASSGDTAGGLADLAPLAPQMDCGDVASLDLSDVTDAPVTITWAGVVDSAPAPFCEVRGTISPANSIVLRLPTQGWTQRYVQTGCGGFCGAAYIDNPQAVGCVPITDATTAMAGTDMGHDGQDDASFAVDNPQAVIDFAYRSVHVTAQVAKAIIARYYGKRPTYSYFDGCSDGGREALMEAQRYPHDFDGIAAGAPANNIAAQNTFHPAWNVLANLDKEGRYILTTDKLTLIHGAVLAECDGIDAVYDGVIDDPRLCDFDPRTLTCASGQDPTTCLSPAQADVVQRLHDGANDADGNALEVPISHPWGSEWQWDLFIPTAQRKPNAKELELPYLRYFADPNGPNPDYRVTDLELTKASFRKTVLPSSSYLAAMDPDLDAYQRSGGKLLLWHGWNDQYISAHSTLAYYSAMQQEMGEQDVERFAKLFLFPGVAHCGGGEGPNTFDVLTPVMAWVESGQEPTSIVASTVTDGSVARTRPVYPYPAVAKYDGSGSTDDAANFVPDIPQQPVRDDFTWIGQSLYSHGYQTWGRVEDGELVLEHRR